MSSKTSNQEFLRHYLNIMDELRENGKIFSQQNPDLAPYLDLSYRKSNDPETERLIESFAYMFAQIEHKSFLALNDHIINFIEKIFPELISPLPAFTVLTVTPEMSAFKDSFVAKIPQGTKFSTVNQDNFECHFSTTQTVPILPMSIQSTKIVNFNQFQKHESGLTKAFVLDFILKKPIARNDSQRLSIPLYIDSDFYSAISIYDTIFSSKQNFLLYADDMEKPLSFPRYQISPILQFESQDKKRNMLYPFFDFLNYYQKYLFININLKINFNAISKLKIVIPFESEAQALNKVGEHFFKTNCVPIANFYEAKLEPIKCQKDKDEYQLRALGNEEQQGEILSVNAIVTYDSNTGEAYHLKNFHYENYGVKFNKKNHANFDNILWSIKRSFDVSTKDNGSLHVRLMQDLKTNNPDLIKWPDYLFPEGICTNGTQANSIKPFTEFRCRSRELKFKSAVSLFWPKYSRRPLKHFANIEILKFLYNLDQDLLSKSILNIYDFEKIAEYITSLGSPIRSLFKQLLAKIAKFEIEDSVSQQLWKKQVYYIPGITYKLQFSKKDAFPHGAFFVLNFLNGYFEYIREFNFYIQFEVEKL